MQANPLRGTLVTLACLAAMTLGGCGGGSTSGSGSTSGTGATYSVGGTVSGLGADQSVTLLDNGGDSVNVTGNGGFTFSAALASGAAYAVTVKSHTAAIACTVGNGSGTIGSTAVTSVAVSCATGTETVVYSFASGFDGAVPLAGLVMDSAGNLYGTTEQGGAHGDGTAFEVSATGTETVLHSFGATATDGQSPRAALVVDSAGNLYGTTTAGGAYGDGTVFKLSATGVETILHSFGATATDGQIPYAGLVMDSAGYLYGTTQKGGAYGAGTVFKLSANGTEAVLHSFHTLGAAQLDGQNPQAALLIDSAGNLYGTTPYGGAYASGIAFELSPAGTETILYSFGATATDGHTPLEGLIMDSAGNLYGTTTDGGANGSGLGDGVAFELSATGTETVLHSFGATATDGLNPYGKLLMGSSGNLYGTTVQGGSYTSASVYGDGTVFEISPTGGETVLYSFGDSGPTDGSNPHGALIMDSAGNLYGTTAYGGAHAHGTVFKIS